MKIAIIGAGALGLMFGSLLSKNHEVHLLDVNPEMIDKINAEGIHLHDDMENTDETFYPKAHLNGTLQEKMDVVFVLVKSNYTSASLKANQNLIDGNTYFITLQNGLGNDEKMAQYIDKDHLILGVTRINSRRLGLNEVARANHGITVFGYQDSTKEMANKISEVFNSSSFDAKIEENIKKVIWDKLFLNLSSNAFTAYYNCSIGQLSNDPERWGKASEAIREAVRIANHEGMNYSEEEQVSFNKKFCDPLMSGYTSMWQDVTNHRKTEIHALNGKISELGKLYNIPTPMNDWITSRILELEETF